MKYYEGTWVLTKNNYFIFACGYEKYKNATSHSENCLPELKIQAGFSNFSMFCKAVRSISKYPTFNFSLAFIYTVEDPIPVKPIDFTPYVEYEVITEAVLHKLDRHVVNP